MSIQERTVINEAEEEAKRNKKKILGIFFRRDKNSLSSPGALRPNPDGRSSTDKTSPRPDDYDDDDLPPREEADIGLSPTAAMSRDSQASEEEAVRAIPKTAGFDFKAISKELGKDIDVSRLKQPVTRPVEVINTTEPLERSGSAPTVHVQVDSPVEQQSRRSMMARSVSYAESPGDFDENENEDQGDIATSVNRQLAIPDFPSWGQPSNAPIPSPPLSATIKAPSFSVFNASSAPSNSIFASSNSSFHPRAAPPARPHPPELMANPFANGSTSNGILGGWGKTEKEMAEKNPW